MLLGGLEQAVGRTDLALGHLQVALHRAGNTDRHRLQPVDPQGREYAAQSRIGGRAEYHHHDQAAQVAGPEPHQRSEAAGADQSHAHAEQRRADQDRKPGHGAGNIGRKGGVQHAAPDHRLGAEEGDAERKAEDADPAGVAAEPDILDRAEGAQAPPPRRETAGRADGDARERDRPGRQRRHASDRNQGKALRHHSTAGVAGGPQKMS